MARFADKTPVFAILSFGEGSQLDHAAFTEHLYKLGEHRWQLVNIFDLNRNQGATFEVIAVFKQPME